MAEGAEEPVGERALAGERQKASGARLAPCRAPGGRCVAAGRDKQLLGEKFAAQWAAETGEGGTETEL